jgi:hypothetical protein
MCCATPTTGARPRPPSRPSRRPPTWPGTIVHILLGVYREAVYPALSGSAAEPVTYRAENGPGTAILRGSEPASSPTWTRRLQQRSDGSLTWEPMQTLDEVRANTPWEDHGIAGDPAFWALRRCRPRHVRRLLARFRLTAASVNAIDQGATQLPASLTAFV